MRQFEDNSQEINRKKWGVYIHIPFCRKKCLYCDFFSGGAKHTDWRLYASALLNELKERRDELRITEFESIPSTLYIGGGTPSLMPGEVLGKMVRELNRIVGKTDAWEEFTIEVNPEDVTEDNCRAWRECGVNRVSMGVQTLNDAELKAIGRTHDSVTALRGLRMLKRYFDNVTVDLIFGLPGQTIESWRHTVDTVLLDQPQHISAYSLMFEEGTAMTVLREQGRLTFPDEEECLAMWSYLTETLVQHGYHRYEISNYALPGHESIHNRRYWLGNPYLGLGVAAHSYNGNNIRRANPHNIRAYLTRFNPRILPYISSNQKEDALNSPATLVNPFPKNTPSTENGSSNTQAMGETILAKEMGIDRMWENSFYEEEVLSEKELMEEKVMLSMRMVEGLDLEAVKSRFGENAYNRLLQAAKKQINTGNLSIQSNHLHLTQAGIMISDEIIVDLLI